MSLLLSVTFAECHFEAFNADCRYAECHYAECRGAPCLRLLVGNVSDEEKENFDDVWT